MKIDDTRRTTSGKPFKKQLHIPFLLCLLCISFVAVVKLFWCPIMTAVKNPGLYEISGILYLLLLIVVAALSVKMFRRKERLRAALCLACYLLAVLLPLTDLYESARFAVLRPMREQMATELAEEYNRRESSPEELLEAQTPSSHPFLSRDGLAFCSPDTEHIRVSFLKYDNGVRCDYEVFLTDVAYTGYDPQATSEGYHYSLPQKGYGPHTENLPANHWLLYSLPYGEIL